MLKIAYPVDEARRRGLIPMPLSTIYAAIHRDEIKARRVGGRYLIPRTEIERLFGPIPPELEADEPQTELVEA
jgi:excisionase family DNA binding protein